jgi:hypothetical protein
MILIVKIIKKIAFKILEAAIFYVNRKAIVIIPVLMITKA